MSAEGVCVVELRWASAGDDSGSYTLLDEHHEATAYPPAVVADTIMRTIELGVNQWPAFR